MSSPSGLVHSGTKRLVLLVVAVLASIFTSPTVANAIHSGARNGRTVLVAHPVSLLLPVKSLAPPAPVVVASARQHLKVLVEPRALATDSRVNAEAPFGRQACELVSATRECGPPSTSTTRHELVATNTPMAGVSSVVDDVIAETRAGAGNLTSKYTLSADEALTAGERWVGSGYTEIGKPGSGVFRSADGTRQFRIDNGSITGAHKPGVPHVHLETVAPGSKVPVANNHIPFKK